MIIVLSDQPRHFFQSLSAIRHCTSVIQLFRVCIVLPSGLPAKYPHCILQKGITERELASEHQSVAKKWKITQEVKFKSNVCGVIEEIADPGNAKPAAVRETLHMQPEALSVGHLADIKEESGVMKRMTTSQQ